MELVEKGSIAASSAATVYEATDEVTVPAGKTFKIETSPGGESVLEFTAGREDEVVTISITRRVPA